MYKQHPLLQHLVINTKTNEQFIPGSGIPSDVKYQEFLKSGGELVCLTNEEKIRNVLVSLEEELKQIDSLIDEEKNSGMFQYRSHTFYIDHVTIPGLFMALSFLPEDYKRAWKTADKEANGVDNIFILIGKEDIVAMYLAQMDMITTVWAEGEKKKQEVKAKYRDILSNINKKEGV